MKMELLVERRKGTFSVILGMMLSMGAANRSFTNSWNC
jgi:hypothetical protein